MIEVKELNDANLPDAERIVRSRFGEDGVRVVRNLMKNPIRKTWPTTGFIGYEDAKPLAFEAFSLRKMFIGTSPIIGKVGGLTCALPDAAPEVFIDVRLRNYKGYAGSVLGFGNTCNPNTAFLTRKNKRLIAGPETCSRYLFAVIHPMRTLIYVLQRKLFPWRVPVYGAFSTLESADYKTVVGDYAIGRIMSASDSIFDRLMDAYVAHNEGVVSSRTSEEIQWIFGDRIESGNCVVLAAYQNGDPVGHIIIGMEYHRRRCRILDMIALQNNSEIIESLIIAAKDYLFKHTPVMALECHGFPSWIEPALIKHLPYMRKLGYNTFSWGISSNDQAYRTSLARQIESEKTWFFGPYDGDACM